MPAFTDHYKNSRQYRNTPSSSLTSIPLPTTAPAPGASAFGGGNAFSSSRARIYPREHLEIDESLFPKLTAGKYTLMSRNETIADLDLVANSNATPRSPYPLNTASPLLSALPNATDLFPRSIPLPSFLSTSIPSTNGPNSPGSATGGVGFGVSVSPPSGPGSYSSGGNYSGSNGNLRQIRGYPGFEEQFTNHNAPGNNGYYNPTQRYAQGSPILLSSQFGGLQLQSREGNYACTFDTLDEPFGGYVGATATGNGGGENVVCLGWEGGVDIWKVGRGVLEQVGRLEGLGGGVKSAKILPTPPRDDPYAAHRPLICLTIHSSVVPTEADPPIIQETETPYSASPPSRPSTSASNRSGHHSLANATDWQARVEIWSLSSRTKIASLFTSPIIPGADFGFSIGGPPPSPSWSGLRVEVTETKIVVGVGISGELYIFSLENGEYKKRNKEQVEWRCLGKVWTCVQTNFQGSFSGDSGITGSGLVDLKSPHQLGMPVFSLSNGWLAYCPAPAGSSVHAGGGVDAPYSSPSVKSQTPPTLPSVTVAVSADGEALLNRFTREVTQELLRGARWAAETGKKALQSYWNGNQNSGSPPRSAPPFPAGTNGGMTMHGMPNGSMMSLQGNPQPSGLGQQLRQIQQLGGTPPPQTPFFPATVQQSANEPRLVSILDLNKISHGDGGAGTQRGSIIPMATFLPQGGTSYLSFAPGGLALLTASTKGDSLFVWDLMRAIHHPPSNPPLGHKKASASLGSGLDTAKVAGTVPGAPDPSVLEKHVRQIARFNRLTVATIIDVGWSSPRGEMLTVVTEKGTVHFFDLPSSAYQWPPPRKPPPSSGAIAIGSNGGAAGAAVSGAVNLLSNSTQPLLSAARQSRSGNSGSLSGGIFVNTCSNNAAKRGGQSNGGSGSPSDNGGIRVSLPQGLGAVTTGCVRFLIGKERGYVAMNGGGILRIYEVRPGGGGSKKRRNGGGVIMNNYLEYELPLLPDGSQQQQQLPIEGEEIQAGGFWNGRHYHHHRSEEQAKYDQDPLSFAEIETNTVFPPFHTDRHIRLFVYTDSGSNNQLPQQHPQRGNDWQHDETRQDTQHKRRGKRGASTPTVPPPPASHPKTPAPGGKEKTDPWVFGLPLPAEKLNIGSAHGEVEFAGDERGLAEAMGSHLKLEGTGANGKKREKVGKKGGRVKGGAFGMEVGMDEGFFEDDCEVLEYMEGIRYC